MARFMAAVAAVSLINLPPLRVLVALVAAAMEALGRAIPTRVFKAVPQGLPTQAAAVALGTQVVQALSLFATQAHSAAQAAQSLLLTASPITPSRPLARSRHKDSTWLTTQK
jgi:hypothetical protein